MKKPTIARITLALDGSQTAAGAFLRQAPGET